MAVRAYVCVNVAGCVEIKEQPRVSVLAFRPPCSRQGIFIVFPLRPPGSLAPKCVGIPVVAFVFPRRVLELQTSVPQVWLLCGHWEFERRLLGKHLTP